MEAFADRRRYKIKNATLVLPSGIQENKSLWIEDGKIQEICDENVFSEIIPKIDVKGLYVAPGCIDTHVHGGGGYDFNEPTAEAFLAVAKAHARYGTTALYPTIAAAPLSVFKEAIRICESVMNTDTKGARILGLHLEGNYINKAMCGGLDPDCLTLPNVEEYRALLDSTSCIKRWSASPELPGALEFGRFATERGVLVSLAHTVADYEIVTKAWESGYRHVTHFYNAMTGVHKNREFKKEGTIEAVFLTDGMTVELIADGVHVPPSILKLVRQIKGVEKTILVTDAMPAAACEKPMGSPDGRVIIEDDVCKLADRSALSGSIATTNRLMRVMVQQAGVSLIDAVRMASETPARIMGIFDRKGSLEKGKDADIIIFDKNFEVQTTIVEGEIVYNKL